MLLPCLDIDVAPLPGEANQVQDGKYLFEFLVYSVCCVFIKKGFCRQTHNPSGFLSLCYAFISIHFPAILPPFSPICLPPSFTQFLHHLIASLFFPYSVPPPGKNGPTTSLYQDCLLLLVCSAAKCGVFMCATRQEGVCLSDNTIIERRGKPVSEA